MDTKIQTKDDFLCDDLTSQSVTSDALLVKDDCDMTNSCSQKDRTCLIKENESESSNKKYMKDTKTEASAQNKREFLQEGNVIKIEECYSDRKTDNEIEVKEEPWWLETQASVFCDEIKDGDYFPVKSPRLFTKAVCGGSSGDSTLPSTDTSGRSVILCNGEDCPECENREIAVTRPPSPDKHVNLEQPGKQVLFISKCEKSHARELTHEGEKAHKCEVCDKNFARLSALKCHNLMHEIKRPHICKICEMSFTHLSHLKMHNFMHKDEKAHKDKICDSLTIYHGMETSYLKNHKESHKCTTCNKRFTHLESLRRHHLLYHVEKPHRCKLCHKRFTSLQTLKRHNFTHQELCNKELIPNVVNGKGKPYNCEICDKRYSYSHGLKRHKQIHEGRRDHECEICGRRFLHSWHLKTHILIHKGIKPHQCKLCGWSFTQLGDLNRHILIHTGTNTHKCALCPKEFTRLKYLKTHYLTHHMTVIAFDKV